MSFENLWADCAIWLNTLITRESTFLEYVCPDTGWHLSNPIFLAIIPSIFLIVSWFPSNNSKKLACVPVVPFDPNNLMLAITWSRSSRSYTRSISQRLALLPTVVGCAGWKCVNPSVGRSLYFIANLDNSLITFNNFTLTSFNASVMMMMSVLSPT